MADPKYAALPGIVSSYYTHILVYRQRFLLPVKIKNKISNRSLKKLINYLRLINNHKHQVEKKHLPK